MSYDLGKRYTKMEEDWADLYGAVEDYAEKIKANQPDLWADIEDDWEEAIQALMRIQDTLYSADYGAYRDEE